MRKKENKSNESKLAQKRRKGNLYGKNSDALKSAGLNYHTVLKNNDAYHALQVTDDLTVTGTTGTNVSDFCIRLPDIE